MSGPDACDPDGRPVANGDWEDGDQAYLAMLTALLPEWMDETDCHAFDGLDDGEG